MRSEEGDDPMTVEEMKKKKTELEIGRAHV